MIETAPTTYALFIGLVQSGAFRCNRGPGTGGQRSEARQWTPLSEIEPPSTWNGPPLSPAITDPSDAAHPARHPVRCGLPAFSRSTPRACPVASLQQHHRTMWVACTRPR